MTKGDHVFLTTDPNREIGTVLDARGKYLVVQFPGRRGPSRHNREFVALFPDALANQLFEGEA